MSGLEHGLTAICSVFISLPFCLSVCRGERDQENGVCFPNVPRLMGQIRRERDDIPFVQFDDFATLDGVQNSALQHDKNLRAVGVTMQWILTPGPKNAFSDGHVAGVPEAAAGIPCQASPVRLYRIAFIRTQDPRLIRYRTPLL